MSSSESSEEEQGGDSEGKSDEGGVGGETAGNQTKNGQAAANGNGRKPSLGHATSLPLPQLQRSVVEPVTKQKSLQRCPTIQGSQDGGEGSPSSDAEKPAVAPKEPIRRKESITWSPFAALGKAASSGVSIVGKTTKAVGTGVVQGTKAVGTGVVTGTKAVGSGVAHAAETVGDGIVTGTKAVGSGVAAVGDGVVSGVTAVQEATVAAGSAVGSAVGEAVDDSASWAKEKRQSVIRHTTKSAQHTVEEDETLGIIAAKYKTTVEQIIKLNKETLAEGDVEVGMVIRVPVVDRRKSSHKNRSTSDFLSSLSTQFGLEGGEEDEGGDATETRCLILSSGGIGPRTVSQGFLILDTDSLILSWGREDPMTIVKEDLANIALVYGAQEQPDFHGMLVEKFDGHCGHSFSETEVFPVCEEPELEEDNVEQEVPRRQLRAQDSDDVSLGSGKNGSFDDRTEGSSLHEGNSEVAEMTPEKEEDVVDGKTAEQHRRISQQGRRRSRKRSSGRRSLSRERRPSLLFEDSMATYVYVELDPSAAPSNKITSSVSPSATELCPSGHGSSAGSSGEPRSCGEELIKKSGSFSLQNQPAFLARVPNETVVRLFSLLMRHYSAKYGVSEFPGEGISFTKLTMDTMNDSSGAEIKMGAVLASKNSFCEPENGELPVLDTSSNILEEDDLLALRDRLPTRLENHPWTLAFSTTRDGFSLSQLYRKLHEVDSVVLLVIQDVDQVIFGGLLSEPPQVTDSFTGNGECWLFSFQSGDLEVYTWTTANQLFIKGCATSLVIGASTGKFGLWFDEDLNKGRSQECATFGNPSLTPSSDFSVNCIEVWAFQHST